MTGKAVAAATALQSGFAHHAKLRDGIQALNLQGLLRQGQPHFSGFLAKMAMPPGVVVPPVQERWPEGHRGTPVRA